MGLLVLWQLHVITLTQSEVTFQSTLPPTLGAGERESIAVAKERDGTVLSNESRVAHYCRQYQIQCIRLPDILRALWVEGVISKPDVQSIVDDLWTKDRMRFKQSVLDAIFAERQS